MINLKTLKHALSIWLLLTVTNVNAGVINFSFTDDANDYAFGRTHIAGTVTGALTFAEDLSIDGIYLPEKIEFTSDLSWLGAADSIINMLTAYTHSNTTGFTFNSGNVVNASYSMNYQDSLIGGLQFRLNSTYQGMNILHWNGASAPVVAIGNTDGFGGANYGAVAVPAPSVIALLAFGLVAVGFSRKKKTV